MLKKVVVGLLLLVLLVAVGVGGAFYYLHASRLQVLDVFAQFSSFARIDVDDILVDFEGNVELQNIDIAPVGYKDKVLIENLKFKQSALIELLKSYIVENKRPVALNLDLTGIIFDVNADYLHKRVEQLKEPQKTLWGLACEEQRDFFSLVKSIGLSQTQSNGTLKLALNDQKKLLNVSVSLNSLGFINTLFEFSLKSNMPISISNGAFLRDASVSSGSLRLSDAGLNLKRLKYCSALEEVPETRYTEYFKESVKLKVTDLVAINTVVLEESILALFEPKVKAVFRIKPKKPLYLTSLLDGEFDILNSPELSLMVNGALVSTEYLPLLKGYDLASAQPELVEEEEKILAEIKEKVVKKVKKVARYRSIDVSELTDYQGQEIRLRTLLGKEIDGVLIKVEQSKIIMQRRVEHGLVTYPVNKKNIASLKVFK